MDIFPLKTLSPMEWRDESNLEWWTKNISGAQNDHLTHALASKNKFLEDMKSRFFEGWKWEIDRDWIGVICCLFKAWFFGIPQTSVQKLNIQLFWSVCFQTSIRLWTADVSPPEMQPKKNTDSLPKEKSGNELKSSLRFA